MGWTTCAKCNERFCLEEGTHAALKKSGHSFHCPWGHSLSFPRGESEIDKLRRERDRLKQSIAYEQDRVREAEAEAAHQRNRANGYKGHATRITKRAKAGVCPCCNRSFAALARHMATQHPTFTPEVAEPSRLKAVA